MTSLLNRSNISNNILDGNFNRIRKRLGRSNLPLMEGIEDSINIMDFNDSLQLNRFPTYGNPQIGLYAKGGGIFIKPQNRGKFTQWAKSRGMGVQEAASKVLSNKNKYSPTIIKRANFARNATKWNKVNGGSLLDYHIMPDGTVMEGKTHSDYIDGTITNTGSGLQVNTNKLGTDKIPARIKGKDVNLDNNEIIITDSNNNPIIISDDLGEANKYRKAVRNKSKSEIKNINNVFASRAIRFGNNDDNNFQTGGILSGIPEVSLIGAGVNLLGNIFGLGAANKANREAMSRLNQLQFPSLNVPSFSTINERVNAPLFNQQRINLSNIINRSNLENRANISSSNTLVALNQANRARQIDKLNEIQSTELADVNRLRNINTQALNQYSINRANLENQFNLAKYQDQINRINTQLGLNQARQTGLQGLFGSLSSGLSQLGQMQIYKDLFGMNDLYPNINNNMLMLDRFNPTNFNNIDINRSDMLLS